MKKIFNITLFFLLLLSFATGAFAEETPELPEFRERVAGMSVVRSIRVGASSERVRIVIDASKPMEFKTMALSSPNRIVIDIPNAWVSPEVSRETMIQSRFASKVRVAQFNADTVRVVVETDVKKGFYDVFVLNLEDTLPRLVMDFGKIGTGTREYGAPSTDGEDKTDGEKDGKDDKKDDEKDKEEPKIPEPVITPGLKDKIIVIDPGHGGEDSGAIGPTGVNEKTITLRISNEVKSLLEKSGAKVVMTRKTDTEVSPKHRAANDVEELQARVDVANKAKADIFVCIHMDSFTSNVANGTTGFYYVKGTAASKKLAGAIQKGVVGKLKTDDRGVKSCNFYVLKHTKMPATLIEVAFLSNPKEEKLINSDEGIKKAAQGIYEGIGNYFGKK